MREQPRISVLLPCHNAESTLSESIASIDVQTFEDYEVLAVDDGSDDRTADILKSWASRDSRVKVSTIQHQGIVPALSTGAKDATGEFLARMDSDDVAMPERFAEQVKLMESDPDIALCGTRVEYFPKILVRDGAKRYQDWINSLINEREIDRDLFVECPIPHPTFMMRRNAFENLGGYVDNGWPEDYDLVLRSWTAGYRMAKVSRVLVSWREHGDRLSRTSSTYSEDAFRRCKVHYLCKRIGGKGVVVWGAGPVGKSFARELLRQSIGVESFVDLDPRKIGQSIYDKPVIHPEGINDYRHCYVVAAVGSSVAREEIRTTLRTAGFEEPTGFCAVA